MAAGLETPVIIPETPVATEETPVTTDESAVTTDESAAARAIAAHEPALPADVVSLEPTPKRKPGRPPGSKNKEPGKPRKPRAKVVPIEKPVALEPDYDAPALPGSRRIPTEAQDSREAMMLRLLTQQANTRQHNKVALWKSWFH